VNFTITGNKRLDAGNVLAPTDSGDFSIYIVGRNGTSSESYLISKRSTLGYFLSMNATAGLYSGRMQSASGAVSANDSDNAADDDAKHLYAHTYDDSEREVTTYLDGDLIAQASDENPTGESKDDGASLILGARVDGIRNLEGEIAEIIILRRLLSSTEQDTLEDYIAARYAIAIS
jgi:hypothetical protein